MFNRTAISSHQANRVLFAGVDIFWLSSNLWSMSIAVTILLTTFSVRHYRKWELLFHVVCWGFPVLSFLIIGIPYESLSLSFLNSTCYWRVLIACSLPDSPCNRFFFEIDLQHYFFLGYLICYASVLAIALSVALILRFVIVRRIRKVTQRESYMPGLADRPSSLKGMVNSWLQRRMVRESLNILLC